MDGAHPSEEWNDGAVTEPRQAASIVVLRDSAEGPEVLLVQRNPAQRFMGGAWVFPGGALDGSEDPRAAGVRELLEEAGVRLPAAEALVPFSRWITPAQVKIRFDTHFFLAAAPDAVEPRPDGGETVGAEWWEPSAALAAFARGSLELVFPTVKTLEQLSGFESADALLAWADGREVVAIEPQVVRQGEVARVVLPGEPGYRD